MSKQKRQTKRGVIDTRLIDTGVYATFEQHFVSDDGTDTPVGRSPIQSCKAIRKGEVLAHIAAEVQGALGDDSEFKGEAKDASKMLGKLETALSESDVENVLYWSYFLGRAMERHHVRQHERSARIGKADQKRRSKGGKTRQALKTETEIQRCHELIDEHSRKGVSRSAVCNRVAGVLSQELRRAIGGKAVEGCWKRRDERPDNA